MRTLPGPLDVRVTRWMTRHGGLVLRVALGIVFLWFGVLKFFPGLSPAEELATKTISLLTLGLALLAVLECAIGLGLISGKLVRLTLLLLAFQMVGAATPVRGGSLHPVPLRADPRGPVRHQERRVRERGARDRGHRPRRPHPGSVRPTHGLDCGRFSSLLEADGR